MKRLHISLMYCLLIVAGTLLISPSLPESLQPVMGCYHPYLAVMILFSTPHQPFCLNVSQQIIAVQ